MRQSKEGKTQEKVNKIFTRGATAILKALNNQLEYILDTDIDKRLNCVYISNIDYDRNESIDDSIILDIEETTNKLNYCNAMTFVRETTLSVIGSAQRSLTRQQFIEVWQRCIGTKPSELTMADFVISQPIEYSELERMIVEEWESKNMLYGVSKASKLLLLNSSEKLRLRLQAEEEQRIKEIMLAEEREKQRIEMENMRLAKEAELKRQQLEEEAKRHRMEEEARRQRMEEEARRQRMEEATRRHEEEATREKWQSTHREDIDGDNNEDSYICHHDDSSDDDDDDNDNDKGKWLQEKVRGGSETVESARESEAREISEDSEEYDPMMEKFRKVRGSFLAMGKYISAPSHTVEASNENASSSSRFEDNKDNNDTNGLIQNSSPHDKVLGIDEIGPKNGHSFALDAEQGDLATANIVDNVETLAQQKIINTKNPKKLGKTRTSDDTNRAYRAKNGDSAELVKRSPNRMNFSKYRNERAIDTSNGEGECLDFADLKHVKRLNVLDCSRNKLHSIRGYVPLNIITLDLSFNELTDLSCLVTAEGLKELNVSYNHIKSPVGLPKSLTTLNLSNNELTTVTDILYLSTCTNLRCLLVEGNPIVVNSCASFDWRLKLVSAIPSLDAIDNVALPRRFNRKNKSEDPAPSSPKVKRIDQEKGDEMRAKYKLESRKETRNNRLSQPIRLKEKELKQLFDRLAGNGLIASPYDHSYNSDSPKRQSSSPAKQLSYNDILKECNDSTIECVKALRVLYIPLHGNVGYTCSSESLENFSEIEIFGILSTANRIIRELRLLQIHDSKFSIDSSSEIQGLEAVSHILYELFKKCYKNEDMEQSIRFAESILDSSDEGRIVFQYLLKEDTRGSQIHSPKLEYLLSSDVDDCGKLQPKYVFERMNKLKQRVLKKIDSNLLSSPNDIDKSHEFLNPAMDNDDHQPSNSPDTHIVDASANLSDNIITEAVEKTQEKPMISSTSSSGSVRERLQRRLQKISEEKQ